MSRGFTFSTASSQTNRTRHPLHWLIRVQDKKAIQSPVAATKWAHISDACKAVPPKLTTDRQHKMAFITHYQWHEFLAGSRSTSPCLYKGFSGHSCQHICSIYKQHGLLIQDCRDGLKSTKHWQYFTCCNIYQYNNPLSLFVKVQSWKRYML